MSIPAPLLKRLEAFLADKVPEGAGGGWPKVDPAEVEALGAIVQGLIKAKYAKDADGDLPIHYTLVDRTRYQSLHFMPLVHERSNQVDLGLLNANLRRAMGNLSIAKEQVEQVQRSLDWVVREQAEQGLPLRVGTKAFTRATKHVDVNPLGKAARDATAAWADAHATELDATDYTSRQAWETAGSIAVSAALDLPMQVHVHPRSAGVALSVELRALATSPRLTVESVAFPALPDTSVRRPAP